MCVIQSNSHRAYITVNTVVCRYEMMDQIVQEEYNYHIIICDKSVVCLVEYLIEIKTNKRLFTDYVYTQKIKPITFGNPNQKNLNQYNGWRTGYTQFLHQTSHKNVNNIFVIKVLS